jgi:hypothetical protein
MFMSPFSWQAVIRCPSGGREQAKKAKRPDELFFQLSPETLTLGTGPDEIQIAGHSFPANPRVPKAAYALSYSYSWAEAPVSKLELDLRDYARPLSVSGTAVDQVEAISAALERDLSQHSAIGGDTVRFVLTGIILHFVDVARHRRNILRLGTPMALS